jgi:hypothetical protein
VSPFGNRNDFNYFENALNYKNKGLRVQYISVIAVCPYLPVRVFFILIRPE